MPDLLRAARVLGARVRALFRRDSVADEIREELEFHVQMRVQGYERAGESPAEAARHARRRVGNLAVLQDRGYDIRGGGFTETVVQDARYAIRQFLKQPGFTAVSVLTLALGSGLSTALFSVIDAALLHPLPYAHPEELVSIEVVQVDASGTPRRMAPSVADVRRWRHVSSAIADIGSGRVGDTFRPLIVDTGVAERLIVGSASEDFLEVYGVAPILGRGFRIDDTRQGAPGVALLGHSFWQSHFGGDPAVVGRIIHIQSAAATIVGVLPAGFYNNTAVWRASQWPDARLEFRGSGTPVLARLRPGITPNEASQQLAAATAPSTLFAKPSVARAAVTSLYENETSDYGATLRALTWAVAFILCIACVNVAGLLLARGATRRQELAIRASIGAGRGRLVRQLLVESLLLALTGSVVGGALAYVSLDLLVTLIPLSLPANSPPTLNATVFGFTLVLAILTAPIFGLLPALKLSGAPNLHGPLAGGTRGSAEPLSRRSGQWLIGVEVALALVLVSGAALMIRSFSKLLSVDLGYDPRAVVIFEVEPLDQAPAVRAQFYPALEAALQRVPGVSAVGAIDQGTLAGGATFFFLRSDDGVDVNGPNRTVLPGYFEAMGVRPLMGRLLEGSDISSVEAALINVSGNTKYFNGAALGHTLRSTTLRPPRQFRIVGIVPDLKHGGPQDRGGPEMYILPDVRSAAPTSAALAMVMRVEGEGRVTADRLKETAESMGPRVLVGRVRTMAELLGQDVERPRHRMLLLTLLGASGLLLTLVGIFGVTAYAVARRRREIGVRIAIGASPTQVLTTMLIDVVKPVASGIATGLAGAAFATRLIAKFLFDTRATDPGTFAVVAATIGATAILAAWLPSRRALRVDPITALRTE